MTDTAAEQPQESARPRPTRWALAPGNFVHLYWVSGLGRTVETQGVIRENGGGCVIITSNPFSALDKGTRINIERIRHVDVITEGREAKEIRRQAWALLKEAAQHINRVSSWDARGFMAAIHDLVTIFPEIRETTPYEDS